MSMTRWLQFVLLALLMLTLGLPSALNGHWNTLWFVVFFGVLWAVLLAFKKYFANNTLFIFFIALVVLGYFEGLPLVVLSAAVCFNLAVWNVANFRSALSQADLVINLRQIETARLARLGFTLAGGFVLTLIPILVQIKLGFLVIALIAILAVVLLGRGLVKLRAEEDEENQPKK